jgi:hypothetical protein
MLGCKHHFIEASNDASMQTGQGTTSNQIAEPIDPLARERRPQHAEHPADLFDKFLVSHRETRQAPELRHVGIASVVEEEVIQNHTLEFRQAAGGNDFV